MLSRAAKRRRTNQPEPDYYQILGLRRDAKHQDIIRAYHREAKQAHPDRPGGRALARLGPFLFLFGGEFMGSSCGKLVSHFKFLLSARV